MLCCYLLKKQFEKSTGKVWGTRLRMHTSKGSTFCTITIVRKKRGKYAQMWFGPWQYTTEDTQVHVNFEKKQVMIFFPNRTAENTPFRFTM